MALELWEPLTTDAGITRDGAETLKIVNVVVTTFVENYVRQKKVVHKSTSTRFRPDRMLRFAGLDGTCLVFRSGKAVIVGLNGTKSLPLVLAHMQGVLARLCGHFVRLTRPRIQNIVVTSNLAGVTHVDLTSLAQRAGAYVTYIAEQFPGARITIAGSQCLSVNLFQSGNYVIPGVKSMDMVKAANNQFLEFMDAHIGHCCT